MSSYVESNDRGHFFATENSALEICIDGKWEILFDNGSPVTIGKGNMMTIYRPGPEFRISALSDREYQQLRELQDAERTCWLLQEEIEDEEEYIKELKAELYDLERGSPLVGE